MEAESLPDCSRQRMVTDCGEAAGHFDEKDQTECSQRDRPYESRAEHRAGLRGSGDGTDLEKAAHTGDDAQRYLEYLFRLHRADSALLRLRILAASLRTAGSSGDCFRC